MIKFIEQPTNQSENQSINLSIIMEFARAPHVDPSDRRQVCKALSLTHSNAEPLTPTCFTLPGGAGGGQG